MHHRVDLAWSRNKDLPPHYIPAHRSCLTQHESYLPVLEGLLYDRHEQESPWRLQPRPPTPH